MVGSQKEDGVCPGTLKAEGKETTLTLQRILKDVWDKDDFQTTGRKTLSRSPRKVN